MIPFSSQVIAHHDSTLSLENGSTGANWHRFWRQIIVVKLGCNTFSLLGVYSSPSYFILIHSIFPFLVLYTSPCFIGIQYTHGMYSALYCTRSGVSGCLFSLFGYLFLDERSVSL